MNLQNVEVGYRRLISYKDNEDEKIIIEAGIDYWFLLEQGFATCGSKKARIDIGEVPASIRISNDIEELKFDFNNRARQFNEIWEYMLSLEDLIKISKVCKKEKMDIENAYEYLYEKISREDVRRYGWNQYEVNERKDKVIDLHYPRYFRKD